jgi:hypothetical protein
MAMKTRSEGIRLFFSESGIPELAAYKPAQRKWLKELAIRSLPKKRRIITRLPLFFGCLGTCLGWVGIPAIIAIPEDLVSVLLWSTVGIGIGGFIGGWVGNQVFLRELRPHLRTVISVNGF